MVRVLIVVIVVLAGCTGAASPDQATDGTPAAPRAGGTSASPAPAEVFTAVDAEAIFRDTIVEVKTVLGDLDLAGVVLSDRGLNDAAAAELDALLAVEEALIERQETELEKLERRFDKINTQADKADRRCGDDPDCLLAGVQAYEEATSRYFARADRVAKRHDEESDWLIDRMDQVASGDASDVERSGADVGLDAIILAELPPWGASARDDGRGFVAPGPAVEDLAYFTAAIDREAVRMMTALFDRAGFVDEYYRRWEVSETDERFSLVAIELFRFRDRAAASEVMTVVRELLDSPAVAGNSEAWQAILARGAADIAFQPRRIAGLPGAVALEASVVDAENPRARGLTYQHVAFARGPVLTAITLAHPPELDPAEGRTRVERVAEEQLDRIAAGLRATASATEPL